MDVALHLLRSEHGKEGVDEGEDRARRLLAETLLMERLEITLVKTSADGTRAEVLTPEEVLSQPEEDGAE
jgi:hypothetical protein